METKIIDRQVLRILFYCAIVMAAAGYLICTAPDDSEAPSGAKREERQCMTRELKIALALAHLLAFLFVPLAMKVFYEVLPLLSVGRTSVFASQLGLAFVMVGVGCEIGWHVTQCWYYENQFTLLNFLFYFFFIAGFTLWAEGLVVSVTTRTIVLNIVFAILLVVSAVLYPVGADVGLSSFKIPIQVAQGLLLGVLTWRGFALLGNDWLVLLFPFFSVVVNLTFIALLGRFGGDPITDYRPVPNAVFHILHDVAGTFLGFFIFTLLFYRRGRKVMRSSGKLE